MKVVFMGTSAFAVPTLQRIIDSSHQIMAVISQPDRPSGRGGKLTPSPIKELALKYSLRVFQPDRIKEPSAIQQVQAMEADLIVVVSYGQIIPASILYYPRYGSINVHASLLPYYRGAAPIQRAIMAGEKETGITIMYMDEGLDTGDIIVQTKTAIGPNMEHGELEPLLAEQGANLLLDTMAMLEKCQVKRTPQDHARATYAQRLMREDEVVDWSQPAVNIHNQLRALSPLPGGYTVVDGVKVKLFNTRAIEGMSGRLAGEIERADSQGLWVQTGQGILEIGELQKAGKRRMPVSEYLKGNSMKTGDLLV
ncbi:MAG: methionyl-tRNA formyltransferase [Syntrophomonadaceae bacterium]|nr:methionyl-tRNA formyltransferase [Syntrophomonadaceae bacterium]